MPSPKKIPVVLSVFLFVGGFLWLWYLKDNTGVPWDEPWGHALGQKSFDYVTGKNEALLKVQNKYVGAGFELIAETVCRLTDTHSFAGKVQVRRVVLIGFFLLGALFLFFSSRELIRNDWYGLSAVAMLFLTPRIVLHGVVNSKDAPIMAVASFFLWASICFWNRRTYLHAFLSGLAAACMVALRIPAVYVLLLWFLLWALGWDADSKKRNMINLLIFVSTAVLFTYICWPILWGNPILNFRNAWVFMSKYPWENEVLFMGQHISALALPSYYVPVWMAITIPTGWLLFFVLGVGMGLYFLFRSKREGVIFLFLMGFVFTPIAAIVILKSVVYDEWRHIFFIYPAFVLVAVYALHQLVSRARRSVFVISLSVLVFVAQGIEVISWSYRYPSFTYLYFNPWIRKGTCGNYEQDYWGFSYKNANEFLLTRYSGQPIPVCYAHLPGVYNYWNLPDGDKQKINRVGYDRAEYLVTTHRFEKESFNFGKVVYEQRVNDCAVITVYHKQE